MAKKTYLDFEQPIAELESKIEELRYVQTESVVHISAEFEQLGFAGTLSGAPPKAAAMKARDRIARAAQALLVRPVSSAFASSRRLARCSRDPVAIERIEVDSRGAQRKVAALRRSRI